GRLGEYLGTTGHRMGPEDAIHAGFADYYVPETEWPDLIMSLEESGDWEAIDRAATPPAPAPLANAKDIDRCFSGDTFRDIVLALQHDSSDWAAETIARLTRNAPLAMATTVELIHRARTRDNIDFSLMNEYRFSYRVAEQGDFKEGIRATIIDKDKSPSWAHDTLEGPSQMDVAHMLMPLGEAEWTRGD
ncbi:MAG: enoyl-CoA hydratase/isomerase family protein, partial [Pseudomonadota bacterium]